MNKMFFGVTFLFLALIVGTKVESHFALRRSPQTHERLRFVPAQSVNETRKEKTLPTSVPTNDRTATVTVAAASNASVPQTNANELKAAAQNTHVMAHADNVVSELPIIGGSIVHVKREEYLKSLIAEGADPMLIQNAEKEIGDVTIVKTEPGVVQLAANEVQIQGCNLAALVQKPVVLSVSSQGKVIGSSQLDTDTSPLPDQILKDCHILASQGRQFQFVTVINPTAEE